MLNSTSFENRIIQIEFNCWSQSYFGCFIGKKILKAEEDPRVTLLTTCHLQPLFSHPKRSATFFFINLTSFCDVQNNKKVLFKCKESFPCRDDNCDIYNQLTPEPCTNITSILCPVRLNFYIDTIFLVCLWKEETNFVGFYSSKVLSQTDLVQLDTVSGTYLYNNVGNC